MIRIRLSYANVMSTIACFAALGGTAFAAATVGTADLKANAVTAPKIKALNVTAPKIAANAVTGAKIAPATIQAADISTAAKNSLKGNTGAPGAAGADGVAIIKRATPTLPFSTNTMNAMVKVIDTTFTQPANDFLWYQLVFHSTVQDTCNTNGGYDVVIDGVKRSDDAPFIFPNTGTSIGFFSGPVYLRPAATAQTRELEVWVKEDCANLSLDEFEILFMAAH